MFQKGTLHANLNIELYSYTFNKQFIPFKSIGHVVKRRTPIMILRSPKHFKVGKHIIQRYTIFFRVLFRVNVTPTLLYNLIGQNISQCASTRTRWLTHQFGTLCIN